MWTVHHLGSSASPLIVHVPHAGTWVPREVRSRLLVDDDELAVELQRMTDWYTDRLALDAFRQAGVSGAVLTNHTSRLLVDPERFVDDREPMAAIGMGPVYQVTSQLRPFRRADRADDERLLTRWFQPYAAAVSSLVDRTLAKHGKAIIVDLHSYPSAPLPYEPDPAAHRPGVCVGTDAYHTPGPLRDAVFDAFARVPGGAAENTPFSGTYVPLAHWQRTRAVTSVMVEMRRDTYQDEPGGPPHAGYNVVQAGLADLLATLIDASGV